MNNVQWNFNRTCNIFIQENAYESVVCEMAAMLSRPQSVKGTQFTDAQMYFTRTRAPIHELIRHNVSMLGDRMLRLYHIWEIWQADSQHNRTGGKKSIRVVNTVTAFPAETILKYV